MEAQPGEPQHRWFNTVQMGKKTCSFTRKPFDPHIRLTLWYAYIHSISFLKANGWRFLFKDAQEPSRLRWSVYPKTSGSWGCTEQRRNVSDANQQTEGMATVVWWFVQLTCDFGPLELRTSALRRCALAPHCNCVAGPFSDTPTYLERITMQAMIIGLV